MAKKEMAEAKRDLVKTGNKELRSKTIQTLRDSNALLGLRTRMGPVATGFHSPHCEYNFITKNLRTIFSFYSANTNHEFTKRESISSLLRIDWMYTKECE